MVEGPEMKLPLSQQRWVSPTRYAGLLEINHDYPSETVPDSEVLSARL